MATEIVFESVFYLKTPCCEKLNNTRGYQNQPPKLVTIGPSGSSRSLNLEYKVKWFNNIKAPKSTKNYYLNNRQNKNLLFDRFCRLFDFVDYDYLSNNRQKMELYTCGLV